jgi:hypothetical protein
MVMKKHRTLLEFLTKHINILSEDDPDNIF